MKIKESLLHDNWDEAFSLALANGKKSVIIELLKPCRIPNDKLVLDCIFLEIKKNLNNIVSLKWLHSYLQTAESGSINASVLHKIQSSLKKISLEDE